MRLDHSISGMTCSYQHGELSTEQLRAQRLFLRLESDDSFFQTRFLPRAEGGRWDQAVQWPQQAVNSSGNSSPWTMRMPLSRVGSRSRWNITPEVEQGCCGLPHNQNYTERKHFPTQISETLPQINIHFLLNSTFAGPCMKHLFTSFVFQIWTRTTIESYYQSQSVEVSFMVLTADSRHIRHV